MAAPQPRRHQSAFLRSKPPAPANGKPAAASSKPKSPASPAQALPPYPLRRSSFPSLPLEFYSEDLCLCECCSSSLEERTVKQLGLTKALTLPEATAVSEACRRMAARRADAKGVLSGIVTPEDISGGVIAEGLRPDATSVAKVMTHNPVFVMSNSPATEALQKMITVLLLVLPSVGSFVELVLSSDRLAISDSAEWRKAAEQGSAIAAAMEGVEQQWGTEFAGPHAFIENLRDHMFKPSLSTIITENSSVPAVSASDLVTVAAKKMREHRVNSVVVMTGNILQGIITGTKSVPRGDTRRKGGQVIACLDALQLTHTAISMAEGASGPDGVANTMIQKFWVLHPAEYDLHRFVLLQFAYALAYLRMVSESLDELVSAIAYRLGTENDKANVNLLYNDDEGDRVLLATDADLVAAIEHARSAGWKVLRLHMDDGSKISADPTPASSVDTSAARRSWPSLRLGTVASAAAIAGVGAIVYLRCSRQ
uniref:Uncharacterized protein n=1 Tax=Aegilops tauschii TaxID=37682 RepID=M8CTQ3_AEGTA